MKNLFLVLIFTLFFICSKGQNIGIGTNTPHASAALDITDSSKGILIPRMTIAQRNGIQNPAVGLMVYQTDSLKGFWSFDGMKWKPILDVEGEANGEMLYWNNGRWVKVAPGAQGQTLTFCNGKPHWGACPVNPFYFGNGVTDINGNSYDTVKICNQVWMKQNLNVSRYRNGDIIPQVTDPTQWANLTTGAWCYYNNDSANGAVYGKLYNWYAVNDPRGLAPEGWHVPSDGEWTTLTDCLGGADIAGGKMKQAGTTHWNSPNTGANNSSEFSGLPGGDREFDQPFNYLGAYAHWWSSTELNNITSGICRLDSYNTLVHLFGWYKQTGFSVRCVKDVAPSTIDSGLVAYYPFNGNANDESGNGNNGTVNGATLTTDRFGNAGKAYSFDGVNDYIHLNNFSLNNQKLTISSWIKVENYFFNSPNQQQSIYYLGTEAGGENPQTNTIDFTIDAINYNPPFLRTNLNYSYGYCGTQTSNTEWLNNITVFDGTNQVIKFYINGILINSCNVTPNAINISSNNINNIGCGWSSNSNIVNNFFKGNIDDIRIYNRALTQEEITYLAGH